MNEQQRIRILWEATNGIRDEYIEEAAQPRRRRPLWVGFAAAVAAALAILIGIAALDQPADSDREVLPFFAIRAYAADGSVAVLDAVGDSSELKTGTSEHFPGKTVYTLEVSLEGYTGDPSDLTNGYFRFFHRGNQRLEPGQADETMAVEWLSKETDGFFGYRITGWCESTDHFSLVIYGEDYKVLHQKEVDISKDGDYRANVTISYTHQDGRTTDELIDIVMQQNYFWSCSLSSDLFQRHLLFDTGFRELTQRPDAAQKLLERYVRSMNGEEIYVIPNIVPDGLPTMCNDYLLGAVLSWDEFWNQMTREEKELFASYGAWRRLEDEDQESIWEIKFPGKKIFTYELIIPANVWPDTRLEVSYLGTTATADDEHLMVSYLFSASWAEKQEKGWTIDGWFDEPTEVTLSVYSGEEIVLQKVIRIAPAENGYQIDLLEE